MRETSRFVKICGVTSVEDAAFVADAGADAIGVNLVPTSKRHVSDAVAQDIASAVGKRAIVVAVVADSSPDRLREVREATGIRFLQFHGRESPADLAAFLPDAFKAVAIGDQRDVDEAGVFPGDWLLVDAKVSDRFGGTGETFDWSLVRGLAAKRKLILAGGLTPENVRDAIRSVDPWGVDVASGVEHEPRVKDRVKVRAFIRAVRSLE